MWAWVNLNAGGNNQCVGDHLAEWAREPAYSPVIELADLPDAVETGLAKVGVALWKAAEAEAATIMVRERLRMAEAIDAERELRQEALGMVDARGCGHRGPAERDRLVRGRIRTAGARQDGSERDFCRRVVRELLPERKAIHVSDITLRIGADLVHEAGEHVQAWGVETVRGASTSECTATVIS